MSGPESTVTFPDNVGSFLIKRFQAFGTKLAIIDTDHNVQLTFNDLQKSCFDAAKAIAKTEAKVLAVVSLNCAHYVVIDLACALAGVVCVDANTNWTKYELHEMLVKANVDTIVVHRERAELAQDAVSAIATSGKLLKIFSLQELVHFEKQSEEMHIYQIENDMRLDAVYHLMFSSGTTGLPKVVQITHGARISAITSLSSDAKFGVPSQSDRLLAALPYYHAYQSLIVQQALYCGALVITQGKFSRDKFLQNMQDYRVTYVHVVPPIAAFLANDELVSNFDLCSLTSVTCAAAPLSAETAKVVQTRLKLLDCRQHYGMTELHCALLSPFGSENYASAGIPIPNVVCKICDTNGNRVESSSLSHPLIGELYVKSPGVTTGYFSDDDGTKELIDEDGWCRTGDLFWYDEDGYYYYAGRLKEIMKYKGNQVSPMELENVIMKHPSVLDCGVFGKQNDTDGDHPAACVVLRTQTGTTLIERESINKFVNEQVAPYKRLRGGIYFVKEVPRSASGKILRKKLAEMSSSL